MDARDEADGPAAASSTTPPLTTQFSLSSMPAIQTRATQAGARETTDGPDDGATAPLTTQFRLTSVPPRAEPISLDNEGESAGVDSVTTSSVPAQPARPSLAPMPAESAPASVSSETMRATPASGPAGITACKEPEAVQQAHDAGPSSASKDVVHSLAAATSTAPSAPAGPSSEAAPAVASPTSAPDTTSQAAKAEPATLSPALGPSRPCSSGESPHDKDDAPRPEQGQPRAPANDEGRATSSPPSDHDTPASAAPPRKRPRSPSPVDLNAPPPPRPTIRLTLPLTKTPSSKADYVFNIPKMAVQQLKHEYPEWTSWYSKMYLEPSAEKPSCELGLSAQELKDLGGLAKLLHKYPAHSTSSSHSRKRRMDEYDVGSYDTKDPFVDDSELGVDEPTHTVRTQADGFYVAQGAVELARAKASAMPSSKSASAFRSSLGGSVGRSWASGRSNKLLAKRAASRRLQLTTQPPSSAKSPSKSPTGDSSAQKDEFPPPAHAADAVKEGAAPVPNAPSAPKPDTSVAKEALASPASRPASPLAAAPSKEDKKKAKYPTRPVHPQLQAMFDHLKQLVSKSSFAVKTKFPPELKPPLIETAKLAVELDEYDDNFFNYLPSIFPYNRFTMMKLTKREFFHKHMAYYKELQEEHMDKLYKLIEESFPTQVTEYEALCQARGVEGRDNTDAGTEEDGENGEENRPADADDLVKRFRWSDEMRDELFTVVTVENAMSEIRNEKLYVTSIHTENSRMRPRRTARSTHASPSTNVYVRALTQIADFFPQDGWVNTTHVSRECT